MIAANVSIRPSLLSAPARSKTPPSELIRPPSNAAVIFFWQIYSDSAEIRIKPLPIARKAILLHR
jgi:hypothetical protein